MTETNPQQNVRWEIPSPIIPQTSEFLGKYNAILQQILYNRGIATDEAAIRYLYPDRSALHDPFLLSGVKKSVDRILSAIQNQEWITVYGDYDVDGVTASALLYETLHQQGAKVKIKIPDRFDEGYGLNEKALREIQAEGVGLVITVDCGIRSIAEAEICKELRLDLIITDHHQPLPEIPDAFAVINPKQPGDEYPFKELAGVGVAYKLAQALFKSLGLTSDEIEKWLDLVALGTVADMAALVGENRLLVKLGLDRIHGNQRLGLTKLCRAAGIDPIKVTSMDIGFKLGPRLNAAGRLESAMNSFNLLVATDFDEAGNLAADLNQQNTRRQEQTRETQQSAIDEIGEPTDEFILFVINEQFNEGIVGLAATRLVEKYHLPAVVGVRGETTTRCSCRSISQFHITAALDECRHLLIRHGGHAAAAGFTVENNKLDELIGTMGMIARRELAGQDLTPVKSADRIVELKDLVPSEIFPFLGLLEPLGYGNPEPIFCCRGLTVNRKNAIGAESRHLKLIVTDGWYTMDCIAFGFGHLANTQMSKVDLLFSYELNEFNGRTNPQLNIKDIKIVG